MAVPKRRTSRARKGKRRSHHYITPPQIRYCDRCNEPKLSHRLCPNCGYSSTHRRILVEMEPEEK